MKINWGTGIVLAFIAFISFIMYFVINMTVNKKYEHDLVTENYYGQELQFQDDINKLERSRTLKENIVWERTTEGIKIVFPSAISAEDIEGTVFLYRPSNKQLDFKTAIVLTDHFMLIPDKQLVGGRWNLSVDWQVKDKAYLYKTEISY